MPICFAENQISNEKLAATDVNTLLLIISNLWPPTHADEDGDEDWDPDNDSESDRGSEDHSGVDMDAGTRTNAKTNVNVDADTGERRCVMEQNHFNCNL